MPAGQHLADEWLAFFGLLPARDGQKLNQPILETVIIKDMRIVGWFFFCKDGGVSSTAAEDISRDAVLTQFQSLQIADPIRNPSAYVAVAHYDTGIARVLQRAELDALMSHLSGCEEAPPEVESSASVEMPFCLQQYIPPCQDLRYLVTYAGTTDLTCSTFARKYSRRYTRPLDNVGTPDAVAPSRGSPAPPIPALHDATAAAGSSSTATPRPHRRQDRTSVSSSGQARRVSSAGVGPGSTHHPPGSTAYLSPDSLRASDDGRTSEASRRTSGASGTSVAGRIGGDGGRTSDMGHTSDMTHTNDVGHTTATSGSGGVGQLGWTGMAWSDARASGVSIPDTMSGKTAVQAGHLDPGQAGAAGRLANGWAGQAGHAAGQAGRPAVELTGSAGRLAQVVAPATRQTKAEIWRAVQDLMLYVERVRSIRIQGFVAEFMRDIDGRMLLTGVHAAQLSNPLVAPGPASQPTDDYCAYFQLPTSPQHQHRPHSPRGGSLRMTDRSAAAAAAAARSSSAPSRAASACGTAALPPSSPLSQRWASHRGGGGGGNAATADDASVAGGPLSPSSSANGGGSGSDGLAAAVARLQEAKATAAGRGGGGGGTLSRPASCPERELFDALQQQAIHGQYLLRNVIISGGRQVTAHLDSMFGPAWSAAAKALANESAVAALALELEATRDRLQCQADLAERTTAELAVLAAKSQAAQAKLVDTLTQMRNELDGRERVKLFHEKEALDSRVEKADLTERLAAEEALNVQLRVDLKRDRETLRTAILDGQRREEEMEAEVVRLRLENDDIARQLTLMSRRLLEEREVVEALRAQMQDYKSMVDTMQQQLKRERRAPSRAVLNGLTSAASASSQSAAATSGAGQPSSSAPQHNSSGAAGSGTSSHATTAGMRSGGGGGAGGGSSKAAAAAAAAVAPVVVVAAGAASGGTTSQDDGSPAVSPSRSATPTQLNSGTSRPTTPSMMAAGEGAKVSFQIPPGAGDHPSVELAEIRAKRRVQTMQADPTLLSGTPTFGEIAVLNNEKAAALGVSGIVVGPTVVAALNAVAAGATEGAQWTKSRINYAILHIKDLIQPEESYALTKAQRDTITKIGKMLEQREVELVDIFNFYCTLQKMVVIKGSLCMTEAQFVKMARDTGLTEDVVYTDSLGVMFGELAETIRGPHPGFGRGQHLKFELFPEIVCRLACAKGQWRPPAVAEDKPSEVRGVLGFEAEDKPSEVRGGLGFEAEDKPSEVRGVLDLGVVVASAEGQCRPPAVAEDKARKGWPRTSPGRCAGSWQHKLTCHGSRTSSREQDEPTCRGSRSSGLVAAAGRADLLRQQLVLLLPPQGPKTSPALKKAQE